MFARVSNLARIGWVATVLLALTLLSGCLAADELATPTLVPTLAIAAPAPAAVEPATPTPETVAAISPLAAPPASDATPAVFFVTPANGATVTTTFGVEMGATGLTVEPAGAVHAGAGHMHILVDSDFVAAGEIIPKDDHHLHFGNAQLTTTLTLPPGEHTLRLQFADGEHHALAGAEYRAEIQVTVK